MSGGADTHSNPSDFDFADIQQDNDDDIEVMVSKFNETRKRDWIIINLICYSLLFIETGYAKD